MNMGYMFYLRIFIIIILYKVVCLYISIYRKYGLLLYIIDSQLVMKCDKGNLMTGITRMISVVV